MQPADIFLLTLPLFIFQRISCSSYASKRVQRPKLFGDYLEEYYDGLAYIVSNKFLTEGARRSCFRAHQKSIHRHGILDERGERIEVAGRLAHRLMNVVVNQIRAANVFHFSTFMSRMAAAKGSFCVHSLVDWEESRGTDERVTGCTKLSPFANKPMTRALFFALRALLLVFDINMWCKQRQELRGLCHFFTKRAKELKVKVNWIRAGDPSIVYIVAPAFCILCPESQLWFDRQGILRSAPEHGMFLNIVKLSPAVPFNTPNEDLVKFCALYIEDDDKGMGGLKEDFLFKSNVKQQLQAMIENMNKLGCYASKEDVKDIFDVVGLTLLQAKCDIRPMLKSCSQANEPRNKPGQHSITPDSRSCLQFVR